ncbi:MAG: DUF4337 family protein [Acidiferrobacter sp.]
MHAHAEAGHHTKLNRLVALLTALLASLGALLGYGITTTQNHAILLKNEAVMVMLKSATLRLEAKRSHPKARWYAKQRALDRQAAVFNQASARLMGPHDYYAQGLVAAEVGIALASVAALTERRWLWQLAIVAALGALTLGLLGLIL